jgi:hypothetical protein
MTNATSVQFPDTQKGLSATLREVAENLPAEKVTIRELLSHIGEQGMLFFCIILTIPFLTPIPLPGVSTVFGFLIMLISIGVILNRIPWLPGFLMKREMNTAQLSGVLQSGANMVAKVERFIFPRMSFMTKDSGLNRLNGIVLFLAGFLLILPLPVIPLSNTIPGWAVLLLALGMLSRDGFIVLAGWLLVVITFIYFGAIAVAAVIAGQSLLSLTRENQSFIWLLGQFFNR